MLPASFFGWLSDVWVNHQIAREMRRQKKEGVPWE